MNSTLKHICSVLLSLCILFTFAFSVIAVGEDDPSSNTSGSDANESNTAENTTNDENTTDSDSESSTDDTTVSPPENPGLDGMSFKNDTCEILLGETYATELIVTPEEFDISLITVIYTTNNDSVATVDANGVITAMGVGEATVTASYSDIECTIEVTVYKTMLDVEEDEETGKSFVKGIELGTKISDIRSMFASFTETDVSQVTVYRDGAAVSDDQNIATGMRVQAGESEFYIVIFGDVTGDGDINRDDVKRIVDACAGDAFADAAYEKAARFGEFEKLDIRLALEISNYVSSRAEYKKDA